MSDGTDAIDLESLLNDEPVPGTETSIATLSVDGVEVHITLRGKWMLVREGEVQVFDDGEQLARFLWDECDRRTDSLVMLYQLRWLHLAVGPVVTCRSVSPG